VKPSASPLSKDYATLIVVATVRQVVEVGSSRVWPAHHITASDRGRTQCGIWWKGSHEKAN
jgi:hypothetical protein